MQVFINESNKNYARVSKLSSGEFMVFFGYSNGTNDAYGNETITGRKSYKTEKTALKKAQDYIL